MGSKQPTNPAASERQGARDTGNALCRYVPAGRRRALLECRLDVLRLDELAAELKRFRAVDQPVFEEWFRERFGPAAAEVRALALRAGKARRWLQEVGDEVVAHHLPPHLAYRAVQARYGGFSEDEAVFASTASANAEAAWGDGTLPWEELYPEATASDANGSQAEVATVERWLAEDIVVSTQGAEPERLRTLYRALARRLHPDVCRRTKACERRDAADLWLRVQRAYGLGDTAELELMATLCALREGDEEDAPAVDLAAVKRELVRQRDGLAATVARLRQLPCWRFPEKSDRPRDLERAERDIGRRLLRRQRQLLRELARLERQLARLAKPPRAPRRAMAPDAGQQLAFEF